MPNKQKNPRLTRDAPRLLAVPSAAAGHGGSEVFARTSSPGLDSSCRPPLLFPGNPQFVCLILSETTYTSLIPALLRVRAPCYLVKGHRAGMTPSFPFPRPCSRRSRRIFSFCFSPSPAFAPLVRRRPLRCASDGRRRWEKLAFSFTFCFALRASVPPRLSHKVSRCFEVSPVPSCEGQSRPSIIAMRGCEMSDFCFQSMLLQCANQWNLTGRRENLRN